MEPTLAVFLFVACVVVTLTAARLFAKRLDLIGSRFGFPEALIGLLTALAADGPEISSALFALAKGQHGVSVGVLVGSNAFNLAAMIGLSGLLAGCVRLSRATLLLEGLAGGAITVIAVAVLLGWLAPVAGAILAACVLAPYLILVLRPDARVTDASAGRAHAGPPADAQGSRGSPADALARSELPVRSRTSGSPTRHLLGLIVLDVAVIVAGSAGMVQVALGLGARWQVSSAVLGTLILAPLTSLPNAITAVRLGLAGRGAALVGETFNSNTLNLAAGVLVPALFVTFPIAVATARTQLWWLVGMTFACLLLLAPSRGMRRPGAAMIVVLYLGFVALQL